MQDNTRPQADYRMNFRNNWPVLKIAMTQLNYSINVGQYIILIKKCERPHASKLKLRMSLELNLNLELKSLDVTSKFLELSRICHNGLGLCLAPSLTARRIPGPLDLTANEFPAPLAPLTHHTPDPNLVSWQLTSCFEIKLTIHEMRFIYELSSI